MNLTQLKKWFTILTFVLTALLVFGTAIAETSPYVLIHKRQINYFLIYKLIKVKINKIKLFTYYCS